MSLAREDANPDCIAEAGAGPFVILRVAVLRHDDTWLENSLSCKIFLSVVSFRM